MRRFVWVRQFHPWPGQPTPAAVVGALAPLNPCCALENSGILPAHFAQDAMATARNVPLLRAALGLFALLAACAAPAPAPAEASSSADASAYPDAADALTDAADATVSDVPAADLSGDVSEATMDSADADGDDAADVVADADADTAADAVADTAADAAPPTGAQTHPLQTAADLVQLLNLHQVVGSGLRQVVQRQYQNGNALCPGIPSQAQGKYQNLFSQVCAISKGGYQVEVAGEWSEVYTDPCQKLAHQLYSLTTNGLTLKGKDDSAPVDLLFEPGCAVSVDSSDGGLSYTWSGNSVWHQLPSAWLPATAALLSGHTISGAQVQRSGDKQTGTELSGWISVDGLAAQIDTPVPLKWLDIPNCFVPTEGQLRLTGSATAVVTFAPGPACAAPTWTRDGVPMGEVQPTFWGWFVLCGGGG